MSLVERADCERMDREDPLAPLRDAFHLPEGLVYLDGNSLGALPRAVMERVRAVVGEEWGRDLIRAWDTRGWLELPRRTGERIGRLVGAEPGSVIVCDSTSVNLYKVVAAARRMRPGRPLILSDTGNFPSDLYVMSSLGELRTVEPEEVTGAIDDRTAVVALTEVDYRTGARHDMGAVTVAAHAVGALVVWDLAHSAGAFPVRVAEAGADFAVGCGYKYLNGGPGAPAFVYVAPRHQARFANPITGWLGGAAPFEFSLRFEPATGIDRALVGTPHVLSLAALDAALDVFDAVDLEALWAKAVALTDLFVALVDRRLAGCGLEVVTPREPSRRGSQVSLRHPDAAGIVAALAEQGVLGDFRTPDIARFGFAPLYVRFVDVWDAVDALAELVPRERA